MWQNGSILVNAFIIEFYFFKRNISGGSGIKIISWYYAILHAKCKYAYKYMQDPFYDKLVSVFGLLKSNRMQFCCDSVRGHLCINVYRYINRVTSCRGYSSCDKYIKLDFCFKILEQLQRLSSNVEILS